MNDLSQVGNILKFLWPLILLELALMVYALYDLIKKGKTKNLSVVIWALIILFINTFGPLLYLLFGRAEDE